MRNIKREDEPVVGPLVWDDFSVLYSCAEICGRMCVVYFIHDAWHWYVERIIDSLVLSHGTVGSKSEGKHRVDTYINSIR